ncbi:hypothetical protein KR222_004666 [Zaprionus bogoriensis]|nr:hypothetical protein KR222_004666 [Zaprionus bogoriensis]
MSILSDDSGLDVSAPHPTPGEAVAANPAPAPAPFQPTTRLSWFLAEVDEGALNNGKANGRKRYCVLHSMELLEQDVSDKYMTRFVEFRLNGVKLEAKLILAADERRLVEAALVAMSREKRDEEEDAQQMLVQYEEEDAAGRRLVQKMTSPLRVTWLSTKPEMGATPIVKLAPDCIAHVLYAYEQRDCMEKVMLYLKTRCFDHVFEDEEAHDPIDDETWLLVQYSPEPEMVVYQVIQQGQTIWRKENQFKDVIAYLLAPDNEAVLQAVVIAFGKTKEEMEAKYDKLRSFSLELDFPMREELHQQLEEGTGTAALFARTGNTLFQRAEQRDDTGEHRQLRRSLDQMTEQAETEAEMIIEQFNIVENINRNVTRRRASEANAPIVVVDDN